MGLNQAATRGLGHQIVQNLLVVDGLDVKVADVGLHPPGESAVAFPGGRNSSGHSPETSGISVPEPEDGRKGRPSLKGNQPQSLAQAPRFHSQIGKTKKLKVHSLPLTQYLTGGSFKRKLILQVPSHRFYVSGGGKGKGLLGFTWVGQAGYILGAEGT